jgi:hypothetical protein
MSTLTENQRYHLILADIAMAAAIRTHDQGYVIATGAEDYVPACIRDGWLARNQDPELRKRVTAMASAGVASLQGVTAERLAAAAQTYGVPLTPDLAERMVDHFAARRDAVLTYDR